MVRQTDISMTTNMEICWTKSSKKYQAEQAREDSNIPAFLPLNRLNMVGIWIVLEIISIPDAMRYSMEDTHSCFWEKWYRAKQLPGHPISRHVQRAMPRRLSYTLYWISEFINWWKLVVFSLTSAISCDFNKTFRGVKNEEQYSSVESLKSVVQQ